MERIAVFPGSFDPFTIGHEYIVRRALPLFDTIYIAIGVNSNKDSFFPTDKRIEWIQEVFLGVTNVQVSQYNGLTIDYCRKVNARYLLRGLRTSSDFEYERAIAQLNMAMAPEIETVFMLTAPEHSAITSSLVREIIRHGGDASKFLPNSIGMRNYKK